MGECAGPVPAGTLARGRSAQVGADPLLGSEGPISTAAGRRRSRAKRPAWRAERKRGGEGGPGRGPLRQLVCGPLAPSAPLRRPAPAVLLRPCAVAGPLPQRGTYWGFVWLAPKQAFPLNDRL